MDFFDWRRIFFLYLFLIHHIEAIIIRIEITTYDELILEQIMSKLFAGTKYWQRN